MPWFALCDKLHSSAAAAKGGVAAVGAYAMAGSWCADHLTDGRIPREVAHRFAPSAVWKKAEVAGLVITTEDGYELVDYLDGNPSREEVLARLVAKSEAKQKAGRAGGLRSGMVRRGEAEPKQTGGRTEADGKQEASETKLPSPSPPLSASPEADPEHTHSAGAPAREEQPPEPAPPPPRPSSPEPPPSGPVPLAKLGPAVGAVVGELGELAEQLRAEGSGLGSAVCEKLAEGKMPTPKQLAKLREIREERAQPALPGVARGRSPPRAPDVQRAEPGSCWSNAEYLTDPSRLPPPTRTGGYGGRSGS